MQKVVWNNSGIWLNEQLLMAFDTGDVLEQTTILYKHLQLNYLKFFKMDLLCKVGFLASEVLLQSVDLTTVNTSKTATYLSTKDGCLDVDQKFHDSMQTLPSPALFVYTLPNIVLGEICIRNKFKGEQLAYISQHIDKEDIQFYVNDAFQYRNQKHCLCGHINAYNNDVNVELFWLDKGSEWNL